MISETNSLVILSIVSSLVYALYLAILPRPIAGIPHNASAARRILGDVPSALRCRKENHEMSGFVTDQLVKLNNPVIQLFLRPFGKPWVVVADFREAHDVLLRRSREFDRSDFFSNLFTATMPACQVQMRTGEEWKVGFCHLAARASIEVSTRANVLTISFAGPPKTDSRHDVPSLPTQHRQALAFPQPGRLGSTVAGQVSALPKAARLGERRRPAHHA
jgi:hypothetical protein